MERIQLKMEAQSKYETIKSLVDHKNCSDFTSSKKRAAVQLNCTLRTINRLIKRYEANGKAAFVHGNRGRKPAHALSEERAAEILTLYTNKYYDATFAYACELLAEHDGISISPSALSSYVPPSHDLSPYDKKKRKQLADQLRTRQKETASKKRKQQLQEAIVLLKTHTPDAHGPPISAKWFRWTPPSIYGLERRKPTSISLSMILPDRSSALTLITRKLLKAITMYSIRF